MHAPEVDERSVEAHALELLAGIAKVQQTSLRTAPVMIVCLAATLLAAGVATYYIFPPVPRT